jgi:hypothetical protein
MLDVYCILYFPHMLGGFLHICALYMYYICGLWPPDNVSCIFLTWYQSIRFFFHYRTRNSCSTSDPVCSVRPPPAISYPSLVSPHRARPGVAGPVSTALDGVSRICRRSSRRSSLPRPDLRLPPFGPASSGSVSTPGGLFLGGPRTRCPSLCAPPLRPPRRIPRPVFVSISGIGHLHRAQHLVPAPNISGIWSPAPRPATRLFPQESTESAIGRPE